MGCNTVAITGPSLLLSPFFPLRFFPSIYLSPFLPLFPRFLVPAVSSLLQLFRPFSFFSLRRRNYLQSQTNSQLQRKAAHPRRWLRLPSPSALPFYRRFSRSVHTRAVRVSATRAHAFRIHLLRCHRHVAFTLPALYPASWFSTRKISSVSFAAVRPAEVKPFHPRFFPARESACHLGGARFHLYLKGGGCRNGTQ